MNSIVRVMFALLFFWSCIGFVKGNGNETTLTPSELTVTEHKSLTLSCNISVTPETSYIYWKVNNINYKVNFKETECRANRRPLNRTDMYKLRCINDSVSVTIINVDKEQHNDVWQCIYGFSASNIVHIFVTVPVQTVKISIHKRNIIEENQTSVFKCETSYSRPPPDILWFLNNGTPSFSDDIQIVHTIKDSYENTAVGNNTLTSTVSKLTFTAQRSLNKQNIYCLANNTSGASVNSTMETLNITYPPDGPPFIRGFGNGEVYSVINKFEGRLSCSVSGGNPFPQLNWICAMNGSQNAKISNMTVTNDFVWTAAIDNKGNCTCQSAHKETISSVTINIDVMFPPSTPTLYLQSRNKTKHNVSSVIHIIENNSFTLTCSARSNPASKYSWSGAVASDTNLLNVQAVNRSLEGLYTCTASNLMQQSNGTKIQGRSNYNIRLNILYPPRSLTLTILYTNGTKVQAPDILHIIENDSLDLACNATGKPPPMFSWNGPIPSRSKDLKLQTVNRSMEGNYTCSAGNTMNETIGTSFAVEKNSSIYLNIQYPPDEMNITLHHANGLKHIQSDVVDVIENDSFNLTCLAKSNPVATYSWAGMIASSTTLVEVHTINRSMSGSYTCFGVNRMKRFGGGIVQGAQNKSVHLGVLYAPEVVQLQPKNVMEGSAVNVACHVKSGNPNNTRLRWTRKGIDTEYNTSVIHLPNVSRSDNMIYTCTAYNIMKPSVGGATEGKSSKPLHLNVMYPTTIESFFLEGSENQSAVVVKQTAEVRLICRVSSNPQSNLSLAFKRKVIHEKSNTDVLNHSHILRSCTDAGHYTCRGDNGLNTGLPASKRLQIIVRCAPELSLEKPLKQNLTSPMHVSVTFTFDCLGYPEPGEEGFKWYKSTSSGWENVTFDRFLISSSRLSSNLTIRNVTIKEYGRYKLEANNEMGAIEQLFSLNPYGKPEPPSELAVIHELTTASAATIQWKAGFNGGPNQQFILQYRHESTRALNVIIVNDYRDIYINHTIIELEGASRYELELFSNNSEGSSSSVYTTFMTNATAKVPGIPAGMIAGIAIGVIAVIGIVFAIFVYRKRSRRGNKNETDKLVYENVPIQGIKLKKTMGAKPPTKKETSFKGLQELDDAPPLQTEQTEYYNSPEKIEQIHTINVSELLPYVLGENEESFGTEYQKLPTGLEKPCTFARKPENIALNRFNGIYPYDHSRVKIHEQPDFFINACYIHGCTKQNAYIASLGPTEKVTYGFRTFWMMVWNEESDIIAMLTNLREPSGMKCEQYWPTLGTNKLYGDIQVFCHGEEVFAEYTTRSLTISKADEQRSITHLHYTAWPDKTVPEDVTSLLEFRQRLKATPTSKKGPIVVHCSAGIGQTGTLIAIDRLIEEGECELSVDVFKCVNSMREQRVKMVQTLEQYIYIYKALVNSLYFDCETIPVENFQEYFNVTNNNIYSKQFQQLKVSVETCKKEEKNARSGNEILVSKNRQWADIPGSQNCVYLYLNRQTDESYYINAVYANSFKKKDYFIIAQSPLPCTVTDFVSMIYQEECCCVVTMGDLIEPDLNVGQYLPSDGHALTFGDIKVSCTTLEAKPLYTVREMKIKQSGKNESREKVAYHFEFNKWMQRNDTPADVTGFVQFIKDVEDYAEQLGEERSHVLVHCLKANERSALYCVVAILMEKMRYERQVSVLNTVRHLRTRRRSAITSMEQLKFCYKALIAYISTFEP